VVEFDDLDGGEIPGRLLSELHHEDHADGEIRGYHHAEFLRLGLLAQSGDISVGEARRPDDPPGACVEDAFGVLPRHRGVGEVDDDIRFRVRDLFREVVAEVSLTGEHHPLGLGHGQGGRFPHLPQGSVYQHSNVAHGSSSLVFRTREGC